MRGLAIDPGVCGEARAMTSRSAGVFLPALRSLGLRHWLWATGLTAIVLVAYVLSIANAVFGIRPIQTHWSAPEIATTVATHLMAAYSVLVGVTIAGFSEFNARSRYLAASVAAVCVTVGLEMVLIAVLPSPAGWNYVPDRATWISRAMWSLTNWSLTVGMAVAVYAWAQRARRARAELEAAERDRAIKCREVLASQLAALQARVEPHFLLSVLAQTEALYDLDPRSGDRMLDGLIDYLRAALPQLRSEGSDLDRESLLCDAYLRIVQLRMGTRLEFRIDVPSELRGCVFPPMLLIPLLDSAVRTGLEPLMLGGSIEVRARAHDGRLHVEVAHTGLQLSGEEVEPALMETLRARLSGLYGAAAGLQMTRTAQGLIAAIEVPREDPRGHR